MVETDLIPKTASDVFSFGFLVNAALATFVFELLKVIPIVHPDSQWPRLFHLVMGIYFMHNIYGNLYYLIATDTSTRFMVLPSTLLPNWHFCYVCEANSPPRSFHCGTCERCILRRDHHCAFAGKCVGYKNQRYFIGLLLHVALGACYAAMLNNFFIWEELGGFSLTNLVKHFFPLIFFVFGQLTLKVTFFTMISMIDFCGSMFAAGLLLYHLQLAVHNQTNNEKNHRDFKYDLGRFDHNLSEVLGSNWKLAMLSPWIKSPLPRDGVKFPNYREFHLNANKSK